MTRTTTWRAAAPAAVLAVALLAGCGVENTRFKEAEQKKGPAVAKNAVPGGTLNKFFPKAEGEWNVKFTDEKPGYASADLEKGGTKVGTLAIFDTVSDEHKELAAEYKDSKDKLDMYPLVKKGALGTAVLVGDRFQVQVRTAPGGSLSEDERKDWIKKFDLVGLATHQ